MSEKKTDDVSCPECGYTFGTEEEAGRCPKCDFPVAFDRDYERVTAAAEKRRKAKEAKEEKDKLKKPAPKTSRWGF